MSQTRRRGAARTGAVTCCALTTLPQWPGTAKQHEYASELDLVTRAAAAGISVHIHIRDGFSIGMTHIGNITKNYL